MCSDVLTVLGTSAEEASMTDPIFEVYEKFKHLDAALSDPRWLDGASLPYQLCADFWRAIKEYVEGKT
jgi:hypothetical protein